MAGHPQKSITNSTQIHTYQTITISAISGLVSKRRHKQATFSEASWIKAILRASTGRPDQQLSKEYNFQHFSIWTFQRVLHFMCVQYLSLFYPTQFWCFRAVQPPLLFFGIYSETAQYVSPVVMASCYQT